MAISYYGMDGGNPHSKLWFCGIEYGEEWPEEGFGWQDVQGFQIPYLVDKQKVGGKFGLAQLKIAIAVFHGKSASTWEELGGQEGICFKMNLYPLPFKSFNSLWVKEHYDKTGFVSKSEYQIWCLNNRFPTLKALVKAFEPKVLICFGLSLETEFLAAFSDSDDQIFEPLTQEEDGSGHKLKWKRINGGKTLVMICPFPTGRHGLNSDKSLKWVAEIAKKPGNL